MRGGFRSGTPLRVTPRTIFGSSLSVWLRADLGITLASTKVSAWADQSGNGNDCSQSTDSKRPTYNSSVAGFNGRPTIAANAADNQLLGTIASSVSQPANVFLCGIANNAGGSCVLFDGNTEGSSYIYEAGGANVWRMHAGSGVVTAVSSASKSVVNGEFNGASSKVFVNSLTASASGDAGAGNIATGYSILNSRTTLSFATGAELAEIFVVTGTVSVNAREAAMRYLGARYGVTITA